jgi:excisionase family DNA binding protein
MITRDTCATNGWPSGEVTFATDALMRVKDVCAVLCVERHTVYKLIDAGVLDAIRVNARVTRIPAKSVQSILGESDR